MIEDLKFFFMIVAVSRNQEQQDGISFDMPEEAMTQSLAFCRSFNDSGQIGNTETFAIAVFNDSQVRSDGGESIIGDLGFGSR